MSKKNRNKKLKQTSTTPPPWWKNAWAKATLIPFSTIVAVVTLAYTYTTSDADALRTRVYQPLFADLAKAENSLKAVSIQQMPPTKTLNDLKQTGAIERIPPTLKERLVRAFQQASETHMAALDIHEIAIREMSSRIMEIRNEKEDRAWLQKTSDALREMTMSKKGISDRVTLVEGATHEYNSKAWDLRDPTRSEPGGPVFVIRDWLEYPGSIKTIEPMWKSDENLYFHSTRSESWYYRITREDLNRNHTTLENFLTPVHETLKHNPSFQKLLTERKSLLSEISKLKEMLTDRIRDPKQLRDLLNL
jgi:hypothetical protein